jgi:8-oxo-dGTP diphosphatase
VYCLRCGNELVEQPTDNRSRSACPACGYVLYPSLKVGAGVIIERDGALLLLKRGPASTAFPGTWNLPAGYCEAGEPPEVTAEREAAEETGLAVRVGRLFNVYFFDDDPRGNGLLLAYESKVEGGQLLGDGWEAQETGKVTAAGFFPANQLPRPLCGGGHDRAIEDWQRRALDRWQPGSPLRHCPHCTHPLEEHLAFDRLRPTCPACGYVHFREPKVGVSVLVERDAQILLVRRAIEPGLGLWCLPAGFVEWDEAPETAAARECTEETGLVVADLRLLEAAHYTHDFRGPGINLIFRARAIGGRLQPGDDAAAVRWFARAELPPPDKIAFRSHLAALERWRRQ